MNNSKEFYEGVKACEAWIHFRTELENIKKLEPASCQK